MNVVDKMIELTKKLTELFGELSKLIWSIGSVIGIILYIIDKFN